MLISSAYIHLPFCRRRCFYCDFPITVLGDSGGNKYSAWQREYVEYLCQEIAIIAEFKNITLKTIFFGGGTPSLLAIEGLETIFATLNQHFQIAENAEISLEIDPATFDLTKLKQYQSLGINRVSLGVQAFQDNLLQACGRSHSVTDIYQAVEWIHQAGFDNWSLDLISGLPHQTLSQWHESLAKVLTLQPKHISCYDLVLEDQTVFGKKYQAGNYPLPPDGLTAQMYCLAAKTLSEGGYNHYEISNYAWKGYQCKHNQVYWHNQYYYGFGMGAASYSQNQRFTRPRTRTEYFKWVRELKDNQGKIETKSLSQIDRLLETLMLGLRLQQGVNLALIQQDFGGEVVVKILECLKPYQAKQLVKYNPLTYQLNLTDPQGFLYSNSILADLFHHLEDSCE
jgi:oxygen-independent coproporphyrinogen-3 oxidase